MKSILSLLAFALVVFTTAGQSSDKIHISLEKLHEQGNYEACLKMQPDIDLLAKNQKDTLIANSFSYIGDAHFQLGEVAQAVKWFEREKKLRTDLGLTETESFSISLYNLANAYLESGNYAQAGLAAREMIANDRKLYGASDEGFVLSVLSATDIYTRLDKFTDAEKLLESTIRQQEKGSLQQGLLLGKLGDLFTLTNQYSKAYRSLNDAVSIIEKTAGINSPEYISTSISLGILYMQQGKYAEAEEAFDYALSQINPDDQAYPATLSNQAIVYQNLGQLDRAEKTFRTIQSLDSLSVGTSHPDYAITLSNLGLVYADEEKFKAAENALQRALDIQRKNNEGNTASYARKLNNLAKVHRMAGAPEKAILPLENALVIFKKTLGENSPEFATTSFNLGIAYWKTGKGPMALKYLRSSASIRAAKLGKKHPKYAESIQKIAEYQWEQKQLKEAKLSFLEVFDNYYHQIDATFPGLTEEEKAKFFYTNIKPSFEKFNSFAMDMRASDPSIIGEVFNHQINTKASIMYATEKVKEAIQNSNDTTLIRQFDLWQSEKEQIAKLYSRNEDPAKVDSLQQSADRIEKELTRKSSVFASQFIREKRTWQDVQKNLQPSEAAVEVIRFRTYSPAAGGSFGKDIHYAFLIITGQTKNNPELILMDNGTEMEHKFLNFYRNNIKFTMDDNRSFKNFFETLTDYLQKNQIRKMYFSPDGVFNQININTVKNPATNKYLLDEYQITLVTNSRELIEKKELKPNSQSSILIGFPKFNLQSTPTAASEATTRSMTRGGNLNRSLRGGLLRHMRGEGGIAVLPGTKVEIDQISKLSQDPEVFTEELAAEGLIKQVISPMILHIATHGYFLEDDESALNQAEGVNTYVPSPLLKSGLLLAGSENFLREGTAANDDGDDGILTAYEAMNLKLEDTELVVLSACETGLGVVKNGEGVYGLQRAFKMAGVKSLIMSLWSVDDAATQELMSLFYKEKAQNKDAQAAFRQAQQKLKEKYEHPFYWGAFIMVGI
jgi:CHAT domain-containing protein/tetratricopeptide (TPR) repeat protein